MRKGLVCLLAGFFLFGCQKKDLDPKTALKLAQGSGIPIEGYIAPQYSAPQDFSLGISNYQTLVEAGLLQCSFEVIAYKCIPIDSRLVAQTDALGEIAELRFIAGNFVPSDITGLAQISPDTAKGEIRMSFQPTSFYLQYRGAFDALDESPTPVSEQQQDRIGHAEFQRDDDGWRLKNILFDPV